MRILLVEDDIETQAHIVNSLGESGHVVETAASGREGLRRITESAYELLIIDRMMPEIDGLSLVKAVRATGAAVPILMLTAMGAVADRVEGLEAGADDYLVKPFSLAELSARVAALGRRRPMSEHNAELCMGGLTLDRLKREVRRGQRRIELQPREFQLLELLMLNAGRIVTRTMMLETVWDLHFDPGTNIVETHISRIRAKIDDEGDDSLIQTVRGAGYVIRDT
ncbi:MAG TPA: DNA-binding response regulator [Hyphomonadaceae bacterium]|nr:DNA-binding response regulator [Hyphomonadaceae bacterium]